MGLLKKKPKFHPVKMGSPPIIDREEIEEENEAPEAPEEGEDLPRSYRPEKKAPPKTKPKKEIIRVVKELPVQTIRSTTLEDGTEVTFLTVEEALSELFNQEED